MRGANGKEPELFGLSEESNKENFIASKGGENDLADRLLEEEEEDAVDPDERTIGLVLAVVNLLCPPMAFLF